jgi:uncharacterized membrane protein
MTAIRETCERWFTFQCQRDPSRTLHVFGQLLPVCARCSGIYFGLGLGALIMRPRLDAAHSRRWLEIASLVMLLDVLSEAFGMRPPWAPLRVLSGMALSYPSGYGARRDGQKPYTTPSDG